MDVIDMYQNTCCRTRLSFVWQEALMCVKKEKTLNPSKKRQEIPNPSVKGKR